MIIQDCPVLSIRVLAIRTTTIVAGGVYQTSLASYFLHKNLFGSIMKFIGDEESKLFVGDAFSLLGILASYDKLEGLNPYQVRFADFVDNSTMLKVIQASGHAWNISLERYTNPAFRPYLLANESVNGSSSFGVNIVSWIGGGLGELGGLIWRRSSTGGNSDEINSPTSISPSSSTPISEEDLPHATMSILLAVYEFIHANKVFCRLLIETHGASLNTDKDTKSHPPFVLFISLCSYLLQNQHKTMRASSYARLSLLILRILVEDSSIVSKQLVSEELESRINLCRLRNPSLPLVNGKIILLNGILDSLLGCIRFNMKRTIDYEMYNQTLKVLFQIIASLRASKIRVSYHWTEVWKSIISLIKFLNSHPPSGGSASSKQAQEAHETADLLSLIIATLLIHGETILPDNHQFDDLFYRIVESTDEFNKLRRMYGLEKSPSMAVITATTNHYASLLQPSGSNSLSAEQVAQTIKQGYQTLSLFQYASESSNEPTKKNLLYDGLPLYKESDERLFLKKVTRIVINDTQLLYQSRDR